MKAKFFGLLVVVLLSSFLQPAQAAFEENHLIRVVYDGYNEVLTDLGPVGDFLSSDTGINLSHFEFNPYSDLKVAYFAASRANSDFYLSDNDGQLSNNPFQWAWWSSTVSQMSIMADAFGNGANSIALTYKDFFSYQQKMNLVPNPGAVGTFGHMTDERGGGEANLGAMATGGYAEQYLMYFPEGNAAQQGVVVGNLATGYYNSKIITQMMDASGTFEKPFQSAPPVPVPAAVWVFGAGLLGLMVVRRFQ